MRAEAPLLAANAAAAAAAAAHRSASPSLGQATALRVPVRQPSVATAGPGGARDRAAAPARAQVSMRRGPAACTPRQPPAPTAAWGPPLTHLYPPAAAPCRKRLATVPVLRKCVAGLEVLRGRCYRPELPEQAPLAAALAAAAAGRFPLLVLFPGAGAWAGRPVLACMQRAVGL